MISVRKIIFGIVLFCGIVGLIYISSMCSYRLEETDQVLFTKDEPITYDKKMIKISTWANYLHDNLTESRAVAVISEKEPVYSGALRYYEKHKSAEGNEYYLCQYDDPDWYEMDSPTITIEYDGPIEAKYSIDIGNGWMYYGKSHLNKLVEPESSEDSIGRGNYHMAVKLNIDKTLLSSNSIYSYCSDEMREYNKTETIMLREKYPNVPNAYANISGKLIQVYLFITAYDKADTEKIMATATIKISRFNGFDGWQDWDEKEIAERGFQNMLLDYEFMPYIKFELVDYWQVEEYE